METKEKNEREGTKGKLKEQERKEKEMRGVKE